MDIVERFIEFSPELLALFAGLVLAVATIIRMGACIKCLFFKKSTNQFRTIFNFRKWLAFSMDLLVIAFIAITIFEKFWSNESKFIILICIGIRIALYFAIRAEEKNKEIGTPQQPPLKPTRSSKLKK
ncbi:MAG: hypothetical protein LBD75_05555 [Candidatus Peribacteria bacterium]|jgi:uncharacterized membrane protein|nr:hypothetical protein [Candidatus Peribacteria bacterium]